MAVLVDVFLSSLPVTRISGTGGPTHTATWRVEVDEPLVGDHVLWLAQNGPGTGFPLGKAPIPKRGDRLLWGAGTVIPDIGQTIASHAATYPNGYADAGAFALDFQVNPLPGEGKTKFYSVQVTWRPPNPGSQEYPWQLPAFTGVGVGQNKIPLETTPATTPTTANERRAREYWVEYRSEEVPVYEAYRVTSGTPEPAKSRMVMPNYEPYPPLIDTRLKAVQVIATNVPDPGVAISLNNDFQNTINKDNLQLSSFTMNPYRVTFESARTARPIVNKNTTYYRMEIRLELHYEAPWIEREAIGSYTINGPTKGAGVDEFGIPLARVPLKSDGSAATSQATTHRESFSLKRAVNYSTAFGWT